MKAWHRLVLALGFTFLYAPIALVIIYSFNESRLVTVWAGASLRWYRELPADAQLMASLVTSLEIALTSALLATIFGTAAAYALVRFRFRARLLLAALLYAPLVMPDVLVGVSLLLLFIALGIERGFMTIVAAHATTSLCFVALIVRAKLRDFDLSLEEAAADLGAGPIRCFLLVTLPLIAPAVGAGFLLATTLSLDDFVLASFTSGPSSTTLPMRIYSAVRLGLSPEINAVSTLIVGFVALCLVVAALLDRPKASVT
jgi:putrescine transport system permease protein